MTDVVAPFTGWGRDTWSAQAFGEGNITTSPMIGEVGVVDFFLVNNILVPVIGVPAVSHFGGVMVEPDLNVFPGGLDAVIPAPTAETTISVTLPATSASLVSGFSTLEGIRIDVAPVVGGEQAAAFSSGVIVAPDTNVFPTGLQADGDAGDGTDVTGDSLLNLFGVSTSALSGDTEVTIDVRPVVLGQEADIGVSGVLVWGLIIPDQSSGFVPIAPNPQSNWVEITPEVA
jgi:hypothetical protein